MCPIREDCFASVRRCGGVPVLVSVLESELMVAADGGEGTVCTPMAKKMLMMERIMMRK